MKKTFVLDPDTDHRCDATVELLEDAAGGRRYRITLRAAEQGAAPRTFEVDAAALPGAVLNLRLDNRSIDVGVSPRGPAAWGVLVGAHEFPVEVLDERAMRKRALSSDARGSNAPELKAPMAGRVITLAVQPGMPVKAGQNLLIIEAMKMENDIKAHRDGTITELMVQPGDTVEVGRVLLTIASAEPA